ncbi:pimeloyl-ACP methyl ester carboxylesterase [Salinibacterium sp. CAN_S4]|uniref:haloalkane dehalogenase n=1 Tax=Salinibacterium sp. CAN_S4 TaxID=2787727 RepID=UPI0018F01593
MIDALREGTLRTPDERFASLPDYSFPPSSFTDPRTRLRMHYVDEGDPQAESTFLCLHGQPTWSFLYRKMIPVFADHGRVIAPDLIGFGKSDKPISASEYTFAMHRSSLLALIEHLDLRSITLVCQDWGGLLGLTLPMEMSERFDRLIVMNTSLATGDVELGEGFHRWQQYNRDHVDLDIAELMAAASPGLSPAEAAAYVAPFPDLRYKSGVRSFPDLVPTTADHPTARLSQRAREWWRQEWSGASFMAVGALDPVIPPESMERLRSWIRGCPEPMILSDVGHFVQEHGEQVARAALASFSRERR